MQVVLVIVCIAAAAGFLGWRLIKQFGRKKKDDCGCGKCE